jgi:iron complex transport system permease protein
MKSYWRILFLSLVCVLLFLLDVCVDKVIITPFVFLQSMEDAHILFNIRLPRVLTAFLVGGIMGMCGTVMQTVTRNPLASPYILGISAGAGLGAALATFGFSVFAVIGVSFSAFLGAIMVFIPVFFYIRRQSSRDFTLVLMGTAISSLCNAGITIAQYHATPDQVYQYVFWAMGDLQKSDWASILRLCIAAVLGCAIFLFTGRDLDILSMGETAARSLGISVEKYILLLCFVVCAQTAVSVSIVGIIGFIGLVSPHIARRFLGEKAKYILLGSALTASSLLISADFLSHYFTYPVRFPIGAVTALFGAPFFIWIITKRDSAYD